MTEKLTEKSKKVIDNTLKMVYIIPCITAVVRQPDAGKYARVAQWWSTSLPRRGSRVRSPSRALFIFREAGSLQASINPISRFPDFHEPNIYTYSLESTFADRAVYRTGLRC